MADQRYRKPPITEAVIDLRFADRLDPPTLERAAADFRRYYSAQAVMNAALGWAPPSGAVSPPVAEMKVDNGQRLSASDQTELVLLLPMSFTESQLAPYPGWDTFFQRFVRDWAIWKKTIGYRKIVRVALRYINRIDIPTTSGAVTEESDYVRTYVMAPGEFGPILAYGAQVQFRPDEQGCWLILNTALAPSPLLNHIAIMLDLDVYVEREAPQNDEALFELLERMRSKKNSIFEACITDKSRELFQR